MRIEGARCVLALALLVAGCATTPPAPPIPDSAECIARFQAFDQRTDEAGVRDGAAHRVAGFPYLRSNRFLASFRDSVDDNARFGIWVMHLRELDLDARRSELRNLGEKDVEEKVERLNVCGAFWAHRDLASPERRAQLRKAVEVPDDYSMTRRVLGLYPLVVPFLDLGIRNFDDDVRLDYAKPIDRLDSPGPVTLWRPEPRPPVEASEIGKWIAATDLIGIPRITDDQWQRLAETFAPSWWIETAGDYDRPGAVQRADGQLTVAASRPVTYFLPAFTRFHGKVLPQLVYVVWFSERPKRGHFDAYGGPLDGIVWRVTLDSDGLPLLYDTVHPCGCYHYYFAAKPMPLRAYSGSFWQEPTFFPQQPVPVGDFAVRLQSGTHYVRRLVPLSVALKSESKVYQPADYRELRSLPDASGRTRSLFDADGIVRGTERTERLWLWPAGIESAGAMRQWGRHATSFVGRSHFDDPYLLEGLFR